MAALTRRTWADIRGEVLSRIGRPGDAAAQPRVEQWIDATYRDLCLTYHHYELDTLDPDRALASAATSLSLPADLYAILAVLLKDNAGVEIGRLTPERASYLLGRRLTTAERPEHYTRFGQTIYFAAPTDAAYTVDLYYYKSPAAADFSAGSPVIDRLWDEHIVEGATARGLGAYWSADQAAPAVESLNSFLARVVNPQLATGILADAEDQMTIDRPHGGAQG